MDFTEFWTGVSAVGSLGAAAVAAVAAVQSRKSAGEATAAAREATAAAKALLAIERERRRDELTPDFDVTCTIRDTATDWADMRVVLKAERLERIDEVTITILNEADKDHWAHGLPDGVGQDEAEAFVWGGWEFNEGARTNVADNRTTQPRAYSLADGKNWDYTSMRRTQPGRWMSGPTRERWRQDYEGKPVRLRITSRVDGLDPWMRIKEVIPVKPRKPNVRVIE